MPRINLDGIYYYDDLVFDGKALEEKYYPLLKKETIGLSYDNREILLFKVGSGKKIIICTGGIHGCENINPVVLMKMMESYCELYVHKETIDHINMYQFFHEYTIYFIPLVNPDGYMISLNGYEEIRDNKLRERALTYDIPYHLWKYNSRGVDINRNFPTNVWESMNGGEYAGSEKETQAIIKIMKSSSTCGYLDYHSSGQVISDYIPFMSLEYNQSQRQLGEELGASTNYHLMKGADPLKIADMTGTAIAYYAQTTGFSTAMISTVYQSESYPLNSNNQSKVYQEIKNTPIILGQWMKETSGSTLRR